MTVKDLAIGQSGRITAVGGEGALRQHLLDMGVIPGAAVTLVKLAPLGDPMEVRLHGYELALRRADGEKISIEPLAAGETLPSPAAEPPEAPDHPGLGEGGKYHKPGEGEELPEGTTLTFALVGNQNSGKTTLFNQLTGASQHVGNFPGVTVDRKDGVIRGWPNTRITDLPGIYSMSPYSSEELVSRNFVLEEKPRAIINIVDATNLQRNLYLTMQLLEMDVPMVVALNMMDELRGNGGSIDVNRMEAMLGVPVVPISAAKNEGVAELVDHAIHVAKYQERPLRQDFCGKDDNGGALHRCLHSVRHLIEDHGEAAGLPVAFAAGKLVEGDDLILEKLALTGDEKLVLEEITKQMEVHRGLDRAAAMADMRFAFIERVCAACVTAPEESRERVRSGKIDRVLTGRFTAIPMFIAIMGVVFYLTFNVIGAWLQDLVALGMERLTDAVDGALAAAGVNDVIHGLIISGIFEGVGSVLSFLPIIVVMFFFLSLLEDSGYMARVAFFMDHFLRKLGLSGRSIVPMVIGFGCTVPLTPFMSCTAKIPIYGFFVAAFFPGKGGLIMTGLYVLGILCGVLIAFLYKKTLFRGEPVPLVMELPNYRVPSPGNVARLLWDKAKDFLQRAFSIILIATVVVWFLSNLSPQFNLVTDPQDSILALAAGWLAPLLKPIGLGDWRIVTSLISGFMAKESVVSVMEVLYAGGVTAVMNGLTAATMLVFSLLYTPCVAAIASIRREMGHKWAVGVVVWQCVLAWIVALIVRAVGILILGGV